MTHIDIKQRVDAGELVKVKEAGTTYLVARVGEEYYAIENRCSHLGWSMARGTIDDGTITCPWHGSRFDIRTGENLDWVKSFAGLPMPRWSHRAIALGKRPSPIRTYKCRIVGDRLEILATSTR